MVDRSAGTLLLCGYYGEHNLGDDALLTVLLRDLPSGCRLWITAHDRQALGQPRPTLTFIGGPSASPTHLNPSLSSTGPGQPNPSLLLAQPLASISRAGPRNSSRRNSAAKKSATGTAAPYFPRFGALPIWQTLKY